MRQANLGWRARVEAHHLKRFGKAIDAHSIASEKRFAEANRWRVGKITLVQVHLAIKGYAVSIGDPGFELRGFLGTEEELRRRILFGGRHPGSSDKGQPGLLNRLLASSSLHPMAAAATRQVVARQLGSRFDALGSRLGVIGEGVAHAVESSLRRARRKLRAGESPQGSVPWLRGKMLGDLLMLGRRTSHTEQAAKPNQTSKLGRLFRGAGRGGGEGSDSGRGSVGAPMAAGVDEDKSLEHGEHRGVCPDPPEPVIAFPRAAMLVGPAANTKRAGPAATIKGAGPEVGAARVVWNDSAQALSLPSIAVGETRGMGRASPPARDRPLWPEDPVYFERSAAAAGRPISGVPAESSAHRSAMGRCPAGAHGPEQSPAGLTPASSPALECGAGGTGAGGGGALAAAAGGWVRAPVAYVDFGAAHCAWGGSL